MNELIEEHYRLNYDRLVKRTVWRVPFKSEALAEECVQEAYARAMKYWKTFNPKRDEFNKWFEGILRNATNDCCSQEADRGVSLETTNEDELPLTPNGHERKLGLFYLTMIEDPSLKTVLSMFLLYGYSTKEIGEYTGLKHATVRQMIARWRNKQE